jgi:hypothetical protein
MLDELIDCVIAAGLAVDAECSGGTRFPEPVRQMALYATPGEPPEYTFSGTVIEHPRVQFTFRDVRYDDAARWAVSVWKLCTTIENATLGGTEYISIEPYGSVAGMGTDDNKHPIVFFNARVARVILP